MNEAPPPVNHDDEPSINLSKGKKAPKPRAKRPAKKRPAKRAKAKSKPRKHAKKAANVKKASPRRKVSKKRDPKKWGPSIRRITLKIGAKRNVKQVKFKGPPRRGTAYQPILDGITAKLKKHGDSFPVDIPAGLTPRIFHNRINVMLLRTKPKLPAGISIEKRTVEGNKIEVIAVKRPK